MAKMGFSVQTNAFWPSSFYPQYFWLSRAGTRFCSFSSTTKVFSRLDGREPQSANSLLSNGTLNVDLLELKHRPSYSTFPCDESERQRNTFTFPPLNKPSVHGELNHGIWDGGISAGHTAADWGKATEECKMKKRVFAIRNNQSANLEILCQENIADKAKSGRSNIYEGEGSGLSKKDSENIGNVGHGPCMSHDRASVIQVGRDLESYTNDGEKKVVIQSRLMPEGAHLNGLKNYGHQGLITCMDYVPDKKEYDMTNRKPVSIDRDGEIITGNIATAEATELRKRLSKVYDKVLVVDSITAAEKVVDMLTNQYKNRIHACDTEVANIDVKEETPVNHGEIICFSIYSGSDADFVMANLASG